MARRDAAARGIFIEDPARAESDTRRCRCRSSRACRPTPRLHGASDRGDTNGRRRARSWGARGEEPCLDWQKLFLAGSPGSLCARLPGGTNLAASPERGGKGHAGCRSLHLRSRGRSALRRGVHAATLPFAGGLSLVIATLAPVTIPGTAVATLTSPGTHLATLAARRLLAATALARRDGRARRWRGGTASADRARESPPG